MGITETQELESEIALKDTTEVALFTESVSNSTIQVLNPNIENQYRSYLLNELNKRVSGQEKAKEALVDSLLGAINGVRQKKKPLGTFFFAGPTGVGKTELCHALADILLGDSEALTVIHCEDYQQDHTSRNLFGSPKSYIGYGESTPLNDDQLFAPYQDAQRANSVHPMIRQFGNFSILVLDEIEKAHPKIAKNFLGIMDRGTFRFPSGKETDPKLTYSKVTDFTTTIIIYTSNIGASEMKELANKKSIGFVEEISGQKDGEIREVFKKAMNGSFPPEFIGRLTDTIFFDKLTEKNCIEIIEREERDLNEQYLPHYYEGKLSMKLSEKIKLDLVKKGFSSEKGARDLLVHFNNTVEKSIGNIIASGQLEPIMQNQNNDAVIYCDINEAGDYTYTLRSKTKKPNTETVTVNKKPEEATTVLDVTRKAQSYFFDKLFPDLALANQFAKLYRLRKNDGIDFGKELQELIIALKERGYTERDILFLKKASLDEKMKEFDFINTYEGIDMSSDGNEVFSPIPFLFVEKIVNHYINDLKRRKLHTGPKNDESDYVKLQIEDAVVSLVGAPLNHKQFSMLAMLIHKSLIG